MTQTTQKTCFKCGVPQPFSAFYKHAQTADGHLNKCKTCTKKDTKANRDENIDYYRNYDNSRSSLPHRIEARAEYAASPKGREAGNRAKKMWEKRNPHKKKAVTTVNNAIRDGKLERGTECAACKGTKNIEAHHEDYSKPLDVTWLCKKCHWQADEKRRLAESATYQIPEQGTTEVRL